jgi:hypothetical protein
MFLLKPLMEPFMDDTLSQKAQVKYNPGNLLDALLEKLQLKNEAALSRTLKVAPRTVNRG